MSVIQSRDNRSYEAGADLSAEQFKFVAANEVNSTTGEVVIGIQAVDGGASTIGVLLVGTISEGTCTVTVTGRTMVLAAEGIPAGAPVTSDALGKARKADQVGDTILGTSIKNCSAGGFSEIELFLGGNVVAV